MFFYLGDEIQVIDDDTRLNRKWEYGYNSDIDTIIISKDGTLGSVFKVSGINIGLPVEPDISQFKNFGLPVDSQIWQRDIAPAELNIENWQETRFDDFVDSQFNKRKFGEWILLGGKKVWLVGSYWFFLQEYKELSTYNKLRIIQNEFEMFWEACKADQRCFGLIYLKNRRFGASALGNNELIYTGSAFEDKELGLISKKGDDVKKLFNRLVRAFKRLSPYFKVETDGNQTPKTELIFAEQNRRKRIGEMISEDEGLNTTIRWHNTELNAMDGDAIFRSLLDETGKWPAQVPFDNYWSIVKTSHTVGSDITGKAMVVSTVNSKAKGGAGFQNVWKQSNPEDRNDNGQTESGLYRLFIDAALGLQGFYDKFGFSIVDDPEFPMLNDSDKEITIGADTYLKNKRNGIKSQDKLNEEIRQFPRNVREAFRDESKDCVFNLTKIIEQIDHNTFELEEDDLGNLGIQRGNFTWKDGVPDTEVIFKPNKEGRFWVHIDGHPAPEYRNQRESKYRNGTLGMTPLNIGVGCIGVDPFNRSTTVSGQGSNGGIHLYVNTNTIGLPNDNFIFEYIFRPPKIEIFYEDVIMSMVYYSMPILPEMSSDKFSQYLIDRGYRNYVLNNPFKRYKDLSYEEKRVGGINAQGNKIREAQYQAVNTYIEDYIGIARDNLNRSIGQIGDFPFSRTLEQWRDTDPDNRTDFDAYISSSLALIGAKSNYVRRIEEQDEKAPIKIPFRKYDNTGRISKIV